MESAPVRKRLRALHACDVCRSRKIRCDGQQPCRSCEVSSQTCAYGGASEASTRGKSDLILDAVLRVEHFLHDMNSTIVSSPDFIHRRISLGASQDAFSVPVSATYQLQQKTPGSSVGTPENLQNAVLESMHTSTTEFILQWPHFEAFPSLRESYIDIFHLEQSRPSIQTRASTVYPYTSNADILAIIESFEHNVNFWYPTMSQAKIKAAQSTIFAGEMDERTSTCLASLMMALGCASQVASGLSSEVSLTKEDIEHRASRRAMAAMYIDGVLRKLHVVHMEISTTATQCLFFMALYFAFLRRPLQAWAYINAAATKCRLLLSYTPSVETMDDQECLTRIFWACYILESDYLAELSALPQSGIANIESSIPLPGQYNSHSNVQEEEQSSLYFLACISMRRLLNRVHHVLYARETGVSLDNARFPSVVQELDHQLEEWRQFLPLAFSFSVDSERTATEHGGFLRQRYLTCRSVIYRPYLTRALASYSNMVTIPSDLLNGCKSCLDACLLHIINLRGFAHTVFVDTWICSLSMTAAMLILFAARRIPALRQLIGEEVLSVGSQLSQLIQGWTDILGEPRSPSIDQSLRIINKINVLMQDTYQDGADYQ
ncbi:hypothetical protein F5884DRAFT_318279 [Xylogone sp. PMI_703]|nr:hypothetical protein F5884DRAFT_318279 [Xylogone sp. PMI_703]